MQRLEERRAGHNANVLHDKETSIFTGISIFNFQKIQKLEERLAGHNVNSLLAKEMSIRTVISNSKRPKNDERGDGRDTGLASARCRKCNSERKKREHNNVEKKRWPAGLLVKSVVPVRSGKPERRKPRKPGKRRSAKLKLRNDASGDARGRWKYMRTLSTI
jgi:hypothetical protein